MTGRLPKAEHAFFGKFAKGQYAEVISELENYRGETTFHKLSKR